MSGLNVRTFPPASTTLPETHPPLRVRSDGTSTGVGPVLMRVMLTRTGAPNLMIFKRHIRYVHKDNEDAQGDE